MDTIKGTFTNGMKIGDKIYKDFEMRPVLTMQEMFNAEQQASVDSVLSFNGAMMAMQLVRVGDFDGPFVFSMIGDLSPVDYKKLRDTQLELDKLGKQG